MIPTQGKMTPPATLLMKSPLHWDRPHISSNKSPVLFWEWGRGGGDKEVNELPPPCGDFQATKAPPDATDFLSLPTLVHPPNADVVWLLFHQDFRAGRVAPWVECLLSLQEAPGLISSTTENLSWCCTPVIPTLQGRGEEYKACLV